MFLNILFLQNIDNTLLYYQATFARLRDGDMLVRGSQQQTGPQSLWKNICDDPCILSESGEEEGSVIGGAEGGGGSGGGGCGGGGTSGGEGSGDESSSFFNSAIFSRSASSFFSFNDGDISPNAVSLSSSSSTSSSSNVPNPNIKTNRHRTNSAASLADGGGEATMSARSRLFRRWVFLDSLSPHDSGVCAFSNRNNPGPPFLFSLKAYVALAPTPNCRCYNLPRSSIGYAAFCFTALLNPTTTTRTIVTTAAAAATAVPTQNGRCFPGSEKRSSSRGEEMAVLRQNTTTSKNPPRPTWIMRAPLRSLTKRRACGSQ